MSQSDERLIDAARAIRDFIGHQSSAARKTMNDALANVSLNGGNDNLSRGQNQVWSVGSYLRAYDGPKSRFEIYANRLMEIAQKIS